MGVFMSGSILSAFSLMLAPRFGAPDIGAQTRTASDLSFKGIDGSPLTLSSPEAKAVLVANTASKCGFRKQLGDLEFLHRSYGDRGLVVLGLPSNDFGNQEPHDDTEIAETYRSKHAVTFALAAKVRVLGRNPDPFFDWVGEVAGAKALPRWNFYKYLITGDGRLAAWFATPVRPNSARVIKAIETALK